MKHRDKIILEKIIDYCNKIDKTLIRFDCSIQKFAEDDVFYSASCMYVLQIGELVGKLSDECKAEYNAMPWQSIKDMRNIVAHAYGELELETTWNTLNESVPELKKYCEMILQKEAI